MTIVNMLLITENELIDLYDQIALNEMQLLGLEKYDKMFRNRMYLNVMYQSYVCHFLSYRL